MFMYHLVQCGWQELPILTSIRLVLCWVRESVPSVPVPSVLWCCWMGGRKGIRPVKNWVVGWLHGYLSGARCRLTYAQLMPLPLTVSCSSKVQIGFTFLVPAHPGSPGKRAVKRVCVCILSSLEGDIDHLPVLYLVEEQLNKWLNPLL